ncbi:MULTISPECIES: gluconokinase [Flavobacteriaceae]|uniref:gluconokinase n=1 Tax=Flavobacteriaceae TaxID=49546 RepID=UPI001490D3ED|nr:MULTISPECIES: gluconokinase [Allomuricauda]MDC6364952.1 gluconokinase [Muricauda sp. AC10]
MPENKRILVVMGVSGTGKTTIGKLLSNKLGYPFFDGDDFHPEENIKKMNSRIPLTDEDRKGWLLKLNQIALENEHTGAIIGCSALKKTYRDILRNGLEAKMEFVYLAGSFEQVKSRLESRKGHFMPIELLQSQFDTLEVPEKAIKVSIAQNPDEIVKEVLEQL